MSEQLTFLTSAPGQTPRGSIPSASPHCIFTTVLIKSQKRIRFSSAQMLVNISTYHVTGTLLRAREVDIKITEQSLKYADDGGGRWNRGGPATAESYFLFRTLSRVYVCSLSPRSFELATPPPPPPFSQSRFSLASHDVSSNLGELA